MSRTQRVVFTLSLVVACVIALAQSSAVAGGYRVVQTLALGGEGGWDYLTVDPQQKLLYVPRSTHTMVIDAASGKTVADIPGQRRNHGRRGSRASGGAGGG